MCSIIGASSEGKTIPFDDIKLLFLLGESRGGDACGFTNGKKAIKLAINSYEYVNNIMSRKDFPLENKFFIGHTRYATFGNKKENKNAHPFGKTKLIGVHNGSIFNYKDIAEISDSGAEVDSEVLYDAIVKFGFKETLPLLSGILALNWYVPDNDTIYIYRLGRPLHYGKKDGVMYWASLPHYLEAIDCEDIKEFKEHTLYQIRNGKIVHSGRLKKSQKPSLPNKNKDDSIIKKSTLNIFEDRRENLENLKDDYVNQLLEDYDSIKKPVEQDEEKETVQHAKQSVIIYQDSSLMTPPLNAKMFETEDGDDYIFIWFDPERPYVLGVWEKNYGMFSEFDVTNKDDQGRLYDNFGDKSSDLFDWLQDSLLDMESMMSKRNEFFDENNPTEVLEKLTV